MYKAEIMTVYGPFCGEGGYGTETFTAFDRSPKKAFEKARGCNRHRLDGSRTCKLTNNGGGGVPVLGCSKLYFNGKLILENWD